jgi:alkylation response protein AidB-like acyl-CoA dehydrogenase
LERIFQERATTAVIRHIEGGGSSAELWSDITASGYMDVLLPENDGGADLTLSEAFPLFMLAGKYALPIPFVQTVMARGWLHAHGQAVPQGAIAIAGPEAHCSDTGGLQAPGVAYGAVADWVLGEFDDAWMMLPCDAAVKEKGESRGSQMVDLCWTSIPKTAMVMEKPEVVTCAPAQLAAAALAPLLAGAARQVLDMTLTHTAQRKQFGRAIMQFQSVQAQLSVMAERVWAMRMAAQLVCNAANNVPSGRLAAIAKARCSEAAVTVADSAHALHGAIGITEEYDLQLYTRRLREWRRASGTETWWACYLGQDVISETRGTALDYILSCTK